jgi:hypothetical protein
MDLKIVLDVICSFSLLDRGMDVEVNKIDIPDLLAPKQPERTKSLKKYHVDKRCQLSKAYVFWFKWLFPSSLTP